MMQRVPDNIGIVSAIKENIGADNTMGLTIIYSHICSYPIFTNLYENTKIQKLIGIVSAIIENEAADNGVDHNFTIYSPSLFHICLCIQSYY